MSTSFLWSKHIHTIYIDIDIGFTMSDLVCHIEYGVISPPLFLSSTIIMLCFIYKYLKSIKAEKKASLKYLGLTFFCTQLIYSIVIAETNIVWAWVQDCEAGTAFIGTSSVIASALFFGQYLVMILLLFYRLKVVFVGTTYELSRCTIWTFYTMCALAIIFSLSFSFANDWQGEYSIVEMITMLGAGLMMFSLILFVSGMFVKKLMDVNKAAVDAQKKDGQNLLSAITKQTILSLTSICSMVVVFSLNFVFNAIVTDIFNSTAHADFIAVTFCLIDVWTNFICIFLSYGAFDDYYTKICGCCDTKCKQLCDKSDRKAVP